MWVWWSVSDQQILLKMWEKLRNSVWQQWILGVTQEASQAMMVPYMIFFGVPGHFQGNFCLSSLHFCPPPNIGFCLQKHQSQLLLCHANTMCSPHFRIRKQRVRVPSQVLFKYTSRSHLLFVSTWCPDWWPGLKYVMPWPYPTFLTQMLTLCYILIDLWTSRMWCGSARQLADHWPAVYVPPEYRNARLPRSLRMTRMAWRWAWCRGALTM